MSSKQKLYCKLIGIINNKLLERKEKYKQIKTLISLCESDHDKTLIYIIENIYDVHSDFTIKDKPFNYILDVLNDNVLELLIEILNDIKDIFCIACINDIVWLKKHNFLFAQNAVINYFELIKSKRILLSDTSEYVCRIVDILIKTNKEIIEFSQLEDFCLIQIEKENLDNFVPKFILEALSSYKKCNLNKIDNCCKKIIQDFKDKRMYYNEREYTKFLIKIYKKQNKNVKQLEINIAQSFENEADTYDSANAECSLKIINLLKEAMQCWNNKNLPNYTKERKRIAKKLDPIQALSLEGLKKILLIWMLPISIKKLMLKY